VLAPTNQEAGSPGQRRPFKRLVAWSGSLTLGLRVVRSVTTSIPAPSPHRLAAGNHSGTTWMVGRRPAVHSLPSKQTITATAHQPVRLQNRPEPFTNNDHPLPPPTSARCCFQWPVSYLTTFHSTGSSMQTPLRHRPLDALTKAYMTRFGGGRKLGGPANPTRPPATELILHPERN
jgi:hypothetical protein